MPAGYATLTVPGLLRHEQRRAFRLPPRRTGCAGAAARPALSGMVQTLFDRLLPHGDNQDGRQQNWRRCSTPTASTACSTNNPRRPAQWAHRAGAEPAASALEDRRCGAGTMSWTWARLRMEEFRLGMGALARIAPWQWFRWRAAPAVAGPRAPAWSKRSIPLQAGRPSQLHGGAPGQKPAHRALAGTPIPHIITTSYRPAPIAGHLARTRNSGYPGPLLLSPGGRWAAPHPMARDLRFAWEEMPQQLLDEQAQKVRDSLHAALIHWAQQAGEGSDYTDNLPAQCLHPVGHWYGRRTCCATACLPGCWPSARRCAICWCTTSTRWAPTWIPCCWASISRAKR